MSITTEKQAAANLRRTVKSCHDKLFAAAGKYGGDFHYLETVMMDACAALEKAMKNLTAE